ncbi:MAG: cell division protein ZapB [Desulfovibrio sp.]|jgi:uncharacterized protein (TIGR02449 family)|nr:cell division protein ZapB [Desulfovibrio sp.]
MENLNKLETQISALLEKFDRLRAENASLRESSSGFTSERAALESEVEDLRSQLETETKLRNEAVVRIDTLLNKIQEHNGAE